MKRFISNYTIMGCGCEVINHIITVDDEGKLTSILPFDREMANTCYVPEPLCVTVPGDKAAVERIFIECGSRNQLKLQLSNAGLACPQAGEPVTVLRLDFAHNTITEL